MISNHCDYHSCRTALSYARDASIGLFLCEQHGRQLADIIVSNEPGAGRRLVNFYCECLGDARLMRLVTGDFKDMILRILRVRLEDLNRDLR